MLRRFYEQSVYHYGNRSEEGEAIQAYGMLFFDIELKVDGAGAGGCYAELYRRWISSVICVVQDGLLTPSRRLWNC